MSATTERQRRLFTYRELLELDRSGMFKNQRVELLEGEIIVMPPPNPPHAITTMQVNDSLIETFHQRAINLGAKRIEVYTDPVGEDYLSKRSYGLTDAFALQAFPDVVRAWLPETIFEVLEN